MLPETEKLRSDTGMKRIKILCFEVERLKREKLINLLSRKYDVELLEPGSPSPDLLLYEGKYYSLFPILRGELKKVDCVRVFITGENVKPKFRLFDYAFSYEETDNKNLQLPFFAFSNFFESVRTGCYDAQRASFKEYPKDRFCNYIHRHANVQRTEIVEKLMRYKKVDCAGQSFNNVPRIGKSFEDKWNFIKQHKFTVAFENCSAPHYVTEKIFHSFLVNSVPIYWGSPRIAEYFNPKAFINCHDYDNFDQVVDRVIEVDNDDKLYRQYADAPAVLEGSKIHAITDEVIMWRLEEIVESIGVRTPVATTKVYKLWRLCISLIYGAKIRIHPFIWGGKRRLLGAIWKIKGRLHPKKGL